MITTIKPFLKVCLSRYEKQRLCRTPTLAECGGEAQHLEKSGVRVLRDSRMFRAQQQGPKHLALGCLGVIGKVSKCRCPKWPRIGHLDICSPSYGRKKGRESNYQFDSRPLKVRNRPIPDVRSGSATWRCKALFEGYKIGSDLVAIQGRGEELWLSKVSRVQPGHIRDNFGTPFRESRENVTFGCHSRGVTQSIL